MSNRSEQQLLGRGKMPFLNRYVFLLGQFIEWSKYAALISGNTLLKPIRAFSNKNDFRIILKLLQWTKKYGIILYSISDTDNKQENREVYNDLYSLGKEGTQRGGKIVSDRAFHNLKSLKFINRRMFCSLETPIDGFGGSLESGNVWSGMC